MRQIVPSLQRYIFFTHQQTQWLNEKLATVSPEIMSEVQLSADIIARIDAVLKQKHMTQRDLAKKMGRSEAVISRWTSGFPE
ncbi:MAG: helix-turn-helix transcriptional regulator [Bacteroidales bacterium]|nr:helix-turn-helix transcriptional regulator [Bacteroidales bacterium]